MKNYRGVAIVGSLAIAVGMDGNLAISRDGGVTFSSVSFGTLAFLYGVSIPDSNNIYITAGQQVYHSSDGGHSWNLQSTPAQKSLQGISFRDVNNGLVVGIGAILKTGDGGISYNIIRANLAEDFLAVNGEYCVGYNGSIYKNGIPCLKPDGSRWTPNNLNGVFQIDSSTAIAVGSFRTILKTTDGGATWIQLMPNDFGGQYELFSVFFKNASVGYIVGYEALIWKTIDGGTTWFTYTKNCLDTFTFISFSIDGIGLIVTGSNQIMRTMDGDNWDGVTVNGVKLSLAAKLDKQYDLLALGGTTPAPTQISIGPKRKNQ